MLKFVLVFFLLGFGIALRSWANPTAQIIVLSDHKIKKKAKLNIVALENDFYFHKGYPKLVESKSVGLPPGLWLWIAGYCRSDETITFAPDRNKSTTVNLVLDEQKFLLSRLKVSLKTSYAKDVSSAETSCPLHRLKVEAQFLSKAEASDTGLRWAKTPFSFPELSRFAIYLSLEQPEASNYLASYGYKYMQKDENLLEIIYRNSLNKPL